MTAELAHTASKRNAPRTPAINYRLKSEKRIHYALFSVMFNLLHSINCLKSTSATKVTIMKNTDDFRYEGKPSQATTKLTLFAVNKDESDTKEDTGKSMKNALYVLWYAKRNMFGSNCEKNQPRSVIHYRITLV